jgi:hypothetical protein
MNFDIATKICSAFLALCIFVTVPASAQAAPSLKGHVLGETIQQFLSTSSLLTSHLASCRALKDPRAAQRQDVDWDSCQRLINAVNNNGNFKITSSECSAMNTRTYMMSAKCLEFDGEADFLDGKLSSMRIDLLNPWDDVYKDLKTKFGSPNSTGDEQFENGYGATYRGSNAAWKAESFSLVAREEVKSNKYVASGYLRHVILVLASSDAIAKDTAQEAQRKSTLE